MSVKVIEKFCVSCDEILEEPKVFQFPPPILSSSEKLWCKNKKCSRYGLLTAVWLEKKEKEASH